MESDSSPGGHGTSLARWWGQPPQASPSTDVMNQLCRVCGEPAAGFHFGAFTCEGCKSFFGRTYNNLGSITECKNNGECVINKKNRTACKACRLRKCLLVGMSKSGSRYGRRSNWFKIHCLLQEQQQVSGGAHLKDKAALALWGESYKNSLGMDSDPKSLPSKEGVTINNNTSMKDRERSPPHPAVPPTSYSAEAAAAIWAARNTFLPMPLPPNSMNIPFLPPHFGGFHQPPHPQQQRGFLLPFMHNLHPSRPPLSTSPSRSSHASSYSQSPSPVRTHTPTPCERLQPSEERQRSPTISQKLSEEDSLAILRSLGPVQDQPMDLSVRESPAKHRRKNPHQQRVEENTESDGSVSEGSISDDLVSDSADQNDENFNRRKVPLDLTKVIKVTS